MGSGRVARTVQVVQQSVELSQIAPLRDCHLGRSDVVGVRRLRKEKKEIDEQNRSIFAVDGVSVQHMRRLTKTGSQNWPVRDLGVGVGTIGSRPADLIWRRPLVFARKDWPVFLIQLTKGERAKKWRHYDP